MSKSFSFRSLASALVALSLSSSTLSFAKGPTYTDAAKADEDFAFQGEYVGEVPTREGGKMKTGVQVIALGKGEFQAVGYTGGLPGDGWDKKNKEDGLGDRSGDEVNFPGADRQAKIKSNVLTMTAPGGKVLATFNKVERKSPTLGAKPPEGAVVLFDGKSADAFSGGKVEGELLVAGASSKEKFGSYTLHLEFRTPYQPEDRGQARGNSGVYMQGRYEVQVLDSFGLKGENNECGGLYGIKKPDVNMCLPPLAWQTYDIDYTAAQYANGEKTKNATITVKHNGVVIHDNVELPKATTAAPVKESEEKGPIYLQNHGNPVAYRNIWLVEKK